MESKKKIKDSSEVIKIDCNEDVPYKKKNLHNKKICKHKRRKKLESLDKKTDIKIIQNVKVNKEVFSCIINFNTNISEHKDNKRSCKRKQRKKYNSEHSKDSNKVKLQRMCKPQIKDYFIERVVPSCTRPNCQRYNDKKTRFYEEKERKYKNLPSYHEHRSNGKSCKLNKKSKCGTPRKSLHKHCNDRSGIISPISSLSLKDDIICLSPDTLNNSPLYEDVSPDSFRYSDNELDTLIKRTKDRERRVKKELNNDVYLPYTSTPVNVEETITSEGEAETIFSEPMDISIHSLATLVLEPQTNANYSPLSSEHDWTEIESQNTTGYLYQNHRNLVPCVNDFGPSNLHENIIELNIPNYPHLVTINRHHEGSQNNFACSSISPNKTSELEIDIMPNNFSEAVPIKLENFKRETSDAFISGLPMNNNDYHIIPGYYPVKLENVETTDTNVPSGLLENNVNGYPDNFSVKSETATYKHINL